MKVLVVHLSDIHIVTNNSNNFILNKTEKLVDAVKNLEINIQACFIVVSGDIAFSGKEEEYTIANDLVKNLIASLKDNLVNIEQIHSVFVPGNHDCYLGENVVRDTLVDAINQDPQKADSEDIAKLCTEVQSKYFAFMENFNADKLKLTNNLYYQYLFLVGEKQILFSCYNTAWMSQRHEKQGNLFFSTKKLKEIDTNFDLVFSVFHHPYKWLQADNARAFQKYVEKTSDIILTGHEHDHTRHVRRGSVGETNQYIEGGVLQDGSDKQNSSFNCILIDIDKKKQKFYHFEWSKDFYCPSSLSSEEWEDLQVNQLIKRKEFEISTEFNKWLDDTGATFTNSRKGDLKLSDIFVCPDLYDLESKGDLVKYIASNSVIDYVLNKNVIIIGEERSGKTSLAKRICCELNQRGFIPVFLSGENVKDPNIGKLWEIIYKEFNKQYSLNLLEKYKQLNRSKKILVLDNLNSVKLNTKGKKLLLQNLASMFERVIIFSSNVTEQLESILTFEENNTYLVSYSQCKIAEYGYYLRDLIIDKWFSPQENDYNFDEVDIAKKINEAQAILKTLIGRNFIPSYPIFILTILQLQEAAIPIDTSATTYGYFYEMLIKQSLISSKDPITKNAYLAFVANHFFEESIKEISLKELLRVHNKYCDLYTISLNFEPIINELVATKILDRVSDNFLFKYKYIYYYFTACYMRDHLHKQETKKHIEKLSSSLYKEEAANILLFLTHLSKDPFIIEQMLVNARKIYRDFPISNFETDVSFITNLNVSPPKLTYEEKNVTTARKELMKERDEIDKQFSEEEEEEEEISYSEDNSIMQLNVAFKFVQILGQILKNFPGSILGELKQEIARECYFLGLRSISVIFKEIEKINTVLFSISKEVLKENKSDSKDELIPMSEVIAYAKKMVFTLSMVSSYVLVKHVSHSVSSEKLTEVYKKVLQELKFTSVELIDISIKLDHVTFSPKEVTNLALKLKNNGFARMLLSLMVIEHFRLFDVKHTIKQQICDKLEIEYKSLQTIDLKSKRT